jgi:hypothetical protein
MIGAGMKSLKGLRRHEGFLLLEVLVGISVFGIFIAAVGLTMLYGQESTVRSGARIRASYLAERGMDVARAVRDGSFAALTGGQHGFHLSPTGVWAFTGSTATSTGTYATSVTVSSLASDWVRLTARTTWKHGYNRSGSVVLTTDLTNWRATTTVGNWSVPAVDGSFFDASAPTFVDLALYSGSYVFAASRTGNGLYVIDTRTTTAPLQVASSFSLGTGAWDIAVWGTVLFVATDDSSQEIRAYTIGNPSSLSAANLIGSYNLPGSGRARSIAVRGNTLYVGASADASGGQDEFYAFRVTQAGGITLLDTINDDNNSIGRIALSGTSAYLASALDTGELRVVDVESGSNLVLLGGYNLSDRTLDGVSIAISGTSALLGTLKGSSIQEAVLFDIEGGGIPGSPGPWYHEGSGSVVGLDIEPSRCYAFIAAESGRKALQIFNVRDKSSLTELVTYNSTTGLGRSVLYDMRRDRIFLATDSSILIFRPGTYTGVCP